MFPRVQPHTIRPLESITEVLALNVYMSHIESNQHTLQMSSMFYENFHMNK